jgi:hypothetical protein
MLCLTFRDRERVFLQTSDGLVTIRAERKRGKEIFLRLSIDAPRSVQIQRETAIKKEARASP